MNWQEIIVLIIVGYALYYLVTKFTKKDNCNGNNCDCSQMKYLQTYLKRISILLGMYTASRVFFYFNNIDSFTSATVLEFIECTFNVPADAGKRKDILETLLKDKNLDIISIIQLEFDSSEGILFDDKDKTDGTEYYLSIYNELKNNKKFEI